MISIIIPTLNEEKLLSRLLDNLKNQTFQDFEIIVADADSSDRTRSIAEDYGCKIVDGGFPGVARNNGAKFASGNYLVFFDADVSISNNFLKDAFSEFQERYLEVSTCPYIPDSEDYKSWFDLYNAYAKAFQYVRPSCGGAFMLMTRRIFERVGGFDESLKLAEDHNFVKRASQFAKFRILENVSLTLSVRRFKKEGLVKFLSRAIRSEVYRSFVGEIKDDRFKYELGSYNDEKEFSKERQNLKNVFEDFKKKIGKINNKPRKPKKKKIKKLKDKKNSKEKKSSKKIFNKTR